MGDSLCTFGIPAHTRLLDARAHDLFDGACGGATPNLKPALDVDGIVHALVLILKVSDSLRYWFRHCIVFRRERLQSP
jgi:hypothetical protein